MAYMLTFSAIAGTETKSKHAEQVLTGLLGLWHEVKVAKGG
jgi:hypothetical protein